MASRSGVVALADVLVTVGEAIMDGRFKSVTPRERDRIR